MQFDPTASVPNPMKSPNTPSILFNFQNIKTFEDIEDYTLIYVCKNKSQILCFLLYILIVTFVNYENNIIICSIDI